MELNSDLNRFLNTILILMVMNDNILHSLYLLRIIKVKLGMNIEN